MPTNTLSDNDCKRAAPREKAYKLFDGNGLHLFVTPAGAKVWRQAYRRPADGKPDTLTHGHYQFPGGQPIITLKAARDKRDEALRLLASGIDPKAAARAALAPPKPGRSITLAGASDAFWDDKHDIGEGYRTNAKRGIEMHLKPLLQRDIREITREELLECLNTMNAAGRFVYVRKVRMWASQVWHWAVEQGYAAANVPDTIDPRRAFGRRKVKNFASLRERDFGPFWRRVAMENPDLLSVLATRMLAYTMVRTVELRLMLWTEVDAFVGLYESGRKDMVPDVAREWTWEIPEGKMKRSHPHVVPLPRQAREVLLKLWARRRGSNFVFAAEHRLDRPMSENTVLALLYRLGYKGDMTGHGFRSVASTWGNERNYNADWIERQLSHVEENKIRGTYNKAEYLAARATLLQDLADWIDSHLEDEAGDEDGLVSVAAA